MSNQQTSTTAAASTGKALQQTLLGDREKLRQEARDYKLTDKDLAALKAQVSVGKVAGK